jgi:uncharacterized membrane protein
MKKLVQLIIGAIAIIGAVSFIFLEQPPEFFDIFGILVFIFLFYIGFLIYTKKEIPDYTGFIILLISILGLIVDGYLVLNKYFLGN